MSLEKLKLSKQLLTCFSEHGFTEALPLQSKVIPRANGGQDVVCIAPEGSGRSTTVVLSVINRLKLPFEESPRAIVLVADRDSVEKLVELFNNFSGKTGLRTLGVFAGAGIDGQREAITDGVDIIVGTPDRVLALYLKSGLNINKIQQFILDDAEFIVKQGLQSQVHQITLSLPKCQHMAFTQVYHEKLERMVAYMPNPVQIEVNPEPETILEIIPQGLYQVPNYKTKQNLLNLLMSDSDKYSKVLIFVKTRQTCQNLFKSLDRRFPGEIAILKPLVYEHQGFKSVEEFKKSSKSRLLLVANEIEQFINYEGIQYLLHFDLASEINQFIERVRISNFKQNPPFALTFSTDIELITVKKIETETGNKMAIIPSPPGLVIQGDRKKKELPETDSKGFEKSADPNQGAFHEKKATNAKDYNWGWKEKNKLFGKKYKRSNKK